jgi:hypothetical protein
MRVCLASERIRRRLTFDTRRPIVVVSPLRVLFVPVGSDPRVRAGAAIVMALGPSTTDDAFESHQPGLRAARAGSSGGHAVGKNSSEFILQSSTVDDFTQSR